MKLLLLLVGTVLSNSYKTRDELLENFENLAEENEDLKINYHSEKLFYLEIFANSYGEIGGEKAVFIDCGRYAAAWLAIEICHQLVGIILEEPDRVLDYVILPITNPDGYDYTWTDARNWQKNRAETTQVQKCTQFW